MKLELHNYSRHPAADLSWLASEVERHTSLVAALEFVRRISGSGVLPTVITQDEYTHDVTMRVREDLYLAYGMT